MSGTVRSSIGGRAPRQQLVSMGSRPAAPGLRKPDAIIQKSRFSLRQEKKRVLEKRARALARSIVVNGEGCSCADRGNDSCCCSKYSKHSLERIVIHPEETEGDPRYKLRTNSDGVGVWSKAPRQAIVVFDGCPKMHVMRLVRREFDAGYFVVDKPDRLCPGESVHLVMNPKMTKCRRCGEEKPECCFRTKDVCHSCVGMLIRSYV